MSGAALGGWVAVAAGGGGGALTELVDCAFALAAMQTHKAAPVKSFKFMIIDPLFWTMIAITSSAT
jgi:hypothetical protein